MSNPHSPSVAQGHLCSKAPEQQQPETWWESKARQNTRKHQAQGYLSRADAGTMRQGNVMPPDKPKGDARTPQHQPLSWEHSGKHSEGSSLGICSWGCAAAPRLVRTDVPELVFNSAKEGSCGFSPPSSTCFQTNPPAVGSFSPP